MGRGDANRDMGSPTSSISNGATSTTDERDSWMRNAKVNNDADT